MSTETEERVREVVRGLMKEITNLELRISEVGMEAAMRNGLIAQHEEKLDKLRGLRRRAA